MSGSPRELAQQDRWRIVGQWLLERRTARGLSPQDIVDRVGSTVTPRRLHVLEHGVAEPTDAELDLLVGVLGEHRSVLDAHVQDALLSLVMAGTAPAGLPTIVIVPPTESEGPPADRVLALVRLYQEPTTGGGEITLTGQTVELLAQRCGMSGLECWQVLAKFIPGDRLT